MALLIIQRTVCKTLFIKRMLSVNNLESGLTIGKNWPMVSVVFTLRSAKIIQYSLMKTSFFISRDIIEQQYFVYVGVTDNWLKTLNFRCTMLCPIGLTWVNTIHG